MVGHLTNTYPSVIRDPSMLIIHPIHNQLFPPYTVLKHDFCFITFKCSVFELNGNDSLVMPWFTCFRLFHLTFIDPGVYIFQLKKWALINKCVRIIQIDADM